MQMSNELQFNNLIPKSATAEQMRVMNECLNQIDDILKRECIFCGPILIDMIDNDIDGDSKQSEFAQPSSLFAELKPSSEWDII